MPLSVANIKRKGRALKRALFCLFGAFLLSGNVMAAAPTAPVITANQMDFYQSSTEADRVHFLIDLAKHGQQELAAELLHRVPLQGPHAENRTLFIQGLILEARHDLKGAARSFRDALANDPKLTLVRTELVQVLMALDEKDSAKHHLQLLEADAPDATAAAGIRTFIEKIDQSRPYFLSGYISVAPSTNINRGSSHNTVYSPYFGSDLSISAANKAQSGLGASGGLSLGYIKPLGERFQAVVAGNVDVDLYGDSQFDSVSTSESAELRYLLDNGFVSAGGAFSQGLDPAGRSLTYNSYGPRIALNYQLNQRNLLKASILDEFRKYPNSTVLDGNAILLDLAITHAIDSSMNFTTFGGYEKVNAGLPSLAYSSFYGGLNFYKELPLGITLDVNGQVRLSTFDGDDPFALVTRQDHRYVAAATLTKRDLNLLGFAPSVTYTYTLNQSNIALFDFNSHAINFSLTKDF